MRKNIWGIILITCWFSVLSTPIQSNVGYMDHVWRLFGWHGNRIPSEIPRR